MDVSANASTFRIELPVNQSSTGCHRGVLTVLPSYAKALAANGARYVNTGLSFSAATVALAARLCVIPSVWFAPSVWFDYAVRKNGFHERSLLPSQQFWNCTDELVAAGLPLIGFKLPGNAENVFNGSTPASALTLSECSDKVAFDSIEINMLAARNQQERHELTYLHRAGVVLGSIALASTMIAAVDITVRFLRSRAERSLSADAPTGRASNATATLLRDLKNYLDLNRRLEKFSWGAGGGMLASLILAGMSGAGTAMYGVIIQSYQPSRFVSPSYCEITAAGIPADDTRLLDYKAYSAIECANFSKRVLQLSSYSSLIDGLQGTRRFSEIWAFAGLLAFGVAMEPGIIDGIAHQTYQTLSRFKQKWQFRFAQRRQVAGVDTPVMPAGM